MTSAFIRPLAGTVDGVNDTFTTPEAYLAGTIKVYVNGVVPLVGDDDGWTEIDNTSVQLKEIPQSGDTIQAYYRPE
jgi:hypothetical protein